MIRVLQNKLTKIRINSNFTHVFRVFLGKINLSECSQLQINVVQNRTQKDTSINWLCRTAKYHIPNVTVQRRLEEKNRNSITHSHFKTDYCLKVQNAPLKLPSPISG